MNHVWIKNPEADGSLVSLCRDGWAPRADLVPERTVADYCVACVAIDKRRTPEQRRAGLLPATDRAPVPFRLADGAGFSAPKDRTDEQCQASMKAPVGAAKSHGSVDVEVYPRRFTVVDGNRGANVLTEKARTRGSRGAP